MKIEEARRLIVDFIGDYIRGSSTDGVVIGFSGGLDSSVTAALAVEALGTDKVRAVSLPYCESDPCSLRDAKKIAEHLGLKLEIIDITSAVDAVVEKRASISKIRLGNVCARTRMIYLYDFSAEKNLLVMGTGNRTERLLGYFTLWGDAACAFTPLGDLLKTQERELAKIIGLPDWIITKTPTADLWKDQTDEGELGITYDQADKIIHAIFDLGISPEEAIRSGFKRERVELVINKYNSSEFKRRLPAYPELPGLEFEI